MHNEDDLLCHIEDDLRTGAFVVQDREQVLMHRSYKFRLYPNKETEQKLQWVLDRCRELYNAGLSERKDAWKYAHKSISYYDQTRDLVEIKEIREEYKDIAAHVLYNVLKRVDLAFQGFFRRVKNGQKAGFPRFKGRNKYDSFCYPDQQRWKLEDNYLCLDKIGTIKVKLHRPIEGKIKTVTIKREVDQWYAVFSCEVEQPEPLPLSYEDVGIDLGVTHFAALSDGTFIEHPRYYRKAKKTLERRQQALSRKKRGSHRRARARNLVAKAHRKVRNQRRDFLHKESRKLVNRFQVIAFEDLSMTNLVRRPKPKQDEATGEYLPNGAAAKAGLNTSIQDAGWGMFVEMTTVKAASAGRRVTLVNPYKTSQLCSRCGAEVPKTLEVRWHACPHCGLSVDRDTNSAIIILSRGLDEANRVPPVKAPAVRR